MAGLGACGDASAPSSEIPRPVFERAESFEGWAERVLSARGSRSEAALRDRVFSRLRLESGICGAAVRARGRTYWRSRPSTQRDFPETETVRFEGREVGVFRQLGEVHLVLRKGEMHTYLCVEVGERVSTGG